MKSSLNRPLWRSFPISLTARVLCSHQGMPLAAKETGAGSGFAFIALASLMMLAIVTVTGQGLSGAHAQSSVGTNVTVTEFSVEALTADAEKAKADEAANTAGSDNETGASQTATSLDTTLGLNFDANQDQVDLISTLDQNDTIAFSADNSTILIAPAEAIVQRSDMGISSIDEAVSLITEDAETAADGDASGSAISERKLSGRTDAPTTSVLVTNPPKDSVADGAADAATEMPAEAAAETAAESGTEDQNVAEAADTERSTSGNTLASDTSGTSATSNTGQVSLVRTEVPYSGVADVGIDPVQGDTLDRLIWRGTTAETVIALADPAFAAGGSPALAALADAVMAVRAEQPAEITGRDVALVEARLAWLAEAGRSRDIAVIADALPNDPEWLDWKKWLVVTQLLEMQDEQACRSVMYYSGRTLEAFWHKAKVICNAVQGDATSARFGADLLQATGQNDEIFGVLVDSLLDDVAVPAIDPASLEPLHIVLMEAAHHPIDRDGLNALSPASLQSVTGLRYLSDEARLVRAYRALEAGFLDHQAVAKQWRLANVEDGDVAMALSRHESMPTALTRAMVWRALDAEKTAARLALITVALDVDVAEGAGMLMAPLYAELAEEALQFEDAKALLSDSGEPLATKLALLLAAGGKTVSADDFGAPLASAIDSVSSMKAGGTLAGMAMDGLDLWHLLPLFDSLSDDAGQNADTQPINWLGFDSEAAQASRSFVSTAPVRMRALDQAAAAGRTGETVLIAQQIVAAHGLDRLHPADAAQIHDALARIGQGDVAAAFANDVVAAHLLDTALATDAGGMPVAAPAAEEPAAEASDNMSGVDMSADGAPSDNNASADNNASDGGQTDSGEMDAGQDGNT